jgi:ABC-2 type transport system ATP-binding protein
MIRSLRELGKTILLTTHYLDEAQQLADRVAVVREGVIVRIGAPADLIAGAAATEVRYRENGELVVIETETPTRVLAEIASRAAAAGVELDGLEVRRPTLEDVYLELVGAPPDVSTDE